MFKFGPTVSPPENHGKKATMALNDVLKNLGTTLGFAGAEGRPTVTLLLQMQPATVGRGSFDYGPYTYGWGEGVPGTVVIRCGVVEQTINELTVNVTETWTTTDSKNHSQSHSRDHGRTEIARAFTLAPGQALEGAFAIALPAPGDKSHNWSLHARLGIAGAPDAHADGVPFLLSPPSYAQGLDACLLAALPGATLRDLGYSSKGAINLDYAPPVHLANELDGIRLTLAALARPDNGAVTATLEINPQEKTLADRMRALTHSDRVRHLLTHSRALLEAASPRVTDEPSREIVAHLRGLLAPFRGAGR